VPGTRPLPRWYLVGLTKPQRRQIQKLRAQEIKQKQNEEEHDGWFNEARPMVPSGKTWKEKRIAREEAGSESERGGGAKSDTANNMKE
jgi:hypothetical protein